MKCIAAIKETKSYKLGEIRRTDDIDADQKVASGVWKFIPKSEWKISKKGKKRRGGNKSRHGRYC
jgi:hypothetical protein